MGAYIRNETGEGQTLAAFGAAGMRSLISALGASEGGDPVWKRTKLLHPPSDSEEVIVLRESGQARALSALGAQRCRLTGAGLRAAGGAARLCAQPQKLLIAQV
jgi:hypothetical protein